MLPGLESLLIPGYTVTVAFPPALLGLLNKTKTTGLGGKTTE